MSYYETGRELSEIMQRKDDAMPALGLTAPTPEHLRALAEDLRLSGLRQSSATVRAAADEVDRLRTLIKRNAPHGPDCHLYLTWYERERRCTCWKADAL